MDDWNLDETLKHHFVKWQYLQHCKYLLPPENYQERQIISNEHLIVLVTLHRGLHIVMSKTIRIGNPKYHIQSSIHECKRCPWRFLGIIGTRYYPRIVKFNHLHIDIFRSLFIDILVYIPLKSSVIFVKSRTSTGDFSNFSTSSSARNYVAAGEGVSLFVEYTCANCNVAE